MRSEEPAHIPGFGKVIFREDTKEGRWVCRTNYGPPRGRVETTWPTVEEANIHLAGEYLRSKHRPVTGDMNVTVGELAELWYARRVRKGEKARKTLAADRNYLDTRILPYWGSWGVGAVQSRDVQEWIDKLEAEPSIASKRQRRTDPLSEGMIQKYRQALDGILREGVRRGLITGSAAAKDLVDITARPAVSSPRKVFTDLEVEELWHTIDPRYRAMVVIGACGVGLRVGEWAGLATTDFDPRTRDLSFRRKVSEVEGRLYVEEWLKGGDPGRVIRLGEDMAALWTEHVARHSKNGWVFPSPQGGPLRPNNFNKRFWKPAVTTIGRPEAKFHWLRHTNITLLREEGIDIVSIAKHAGHADDRVTQRVYSHQTDAINDRIADAGDRLLGRLNLDTLVQDRAKAGADS